MKIEKQKTGTAILFDSMTYAVLILFILLPGINLIATGANADKQGPVGAGVVIPVVVVLFSAIIGLPLYKVIQINKFLRGRREAIMRMAAQHAMSTDFGSEPTVPHMAVSSLVTALPDVSNISYENTIRKDDWLYTDCTYTAYKRTRYGRYKHSTVFYAVMGIKLPRQLPNVFFDSKKVRGRQFRFSFSRDQLHSLEGDFDKYFATYFPPDYTIDSMSFISPDVMHALIAASDYDIEIVHDQVFLYGPVMDAETQIPDMHAKLAAIKKQLMDNILTYRDERLPFEIGRKTVTVEALQLRRSRFWARVLIFFFLIYFLQMIIRLVFDFS